VLNEGIIMDLTIKSEGRNSNVFVKAREDMIIVGSESSEVRNT
jgi:hypothetical protein